MNAPQGFLQSVVSGYGGLRYKSNPTYGSQLELTPQERGTVRFKLKAANALWQREAVEARRGRGQTEQAGPLHFGGTANPGPA